MSEPITLQSSEVMDILKNIQQAIATMNSRSVTNSEQYSVGQDVGTDELQKTANGVLTQVMAQEAQHAASHMDELRSISLQSARNHGIQCHLATLQAIAAVGNSVDKLQNVNETDALATTMVESLQRNPALMEVVLAKLGAELLAKE